MAKKKQETKLADRLRTLLVERWEKDTNLVTGVPYIRMATDAADLLNSLLTEVTSVKDAKKVAFEYLAIGRDAKDLVLNRTFESWLEKVVERLLSKGPYVSSDLVRMLCEMWSLIATAKAISGTRAIEPKDLL